ncbi:alpha/beta hydrolase [Adhaeribacter swui]|uniref:Alpha/beta hydrolase n=1 Tax=Adhaeribacter swui TaxID=2086471 RepID=A0A7G7G816_9BACT|nr:alpha/beta hydrolase [Adhaeribacter swui]QNF33300.1 alpha/beta hydrolase [Adhaeribacter swui]
MVRLPGNLTRMGVIMLPTYKILKNIGYGSDPEQVMDIYIADHTPELATNNFTIVFLHGGAFYLSDKSQEEKYIQPYLHKGMPVVNLNYRLKRGIPLATQDLTTALNFLEANRVTYPLNLSQIVLAGFSAGAHIVSLVGLAANNPEYCFKLNKGIAIAAIINFSGVVDGLGLVEKQFIENESYLMQAIGNALFPDIAGYTPQEIISVFEPIKYFDQQDPPYFLWYGGKDDQIPPATFAAFVKLLQEGNDKNVVVFSPESNHFPHAAERDYIYSKIFKFLNKIAQTGSA